MKHARLYHLEDRTVKQIDALAALCGGKEAAVAHAVDTLYTAAKEALDKIKVPPPKDCAKGGPKLKVPSKKRR